ncbi:hypothetical protein HU200_064214 [Digitaria exilis]|uniref:GRF-type domain-containing protein n=1 Tax=Digitaria exilis TaxID=1010633 RepID=A0A835DYX2_9POAL|nr:hypothetical protein HU200_064214 [Digitaria exilis]
MDDLWRQKKWNDRAQKNYPDVSSKDILVPPALPSPQCECGKPARVTQSLHPDTAAREYYKCGDHRLMQDWEQCNFFQWIDGPEKVDERIFLFRPSSSKHYESFQRWLPPPPNPPPMTNEEKKEAIARRLETPPLCHCGDPAQIHRTVKNCSFTPTFECRNRTEVS